MYACAHCDARFAELHQLEQHLSEKCDKLSSVSASALKNPRKSIETRKYISKDMAKKPHACHICHKLYAFPRSLKNHIRRFHQRKHAFTCEICHKTSGSSFNLRKHMYTHTQERPFVCNVCDLSFNDPSNLKKHKQKKHG